VSDQPDPKPSIDLSLQGGTYSPFALIERERKVLGQIASGIPLADVLSNLLLAVESQSTSMMASVLFLSEDGQYMLHGAAPSLPTTYNEAIHGIAIGEGIGSCGTAAARGTPVYVDDIATSPLWEGYADIAVSHGLRACWSMPIKAADGVVLGRLRSITPSRAHRRLTISRPFRSSPKQRRWPLSGIARIND
jgi:hypothetical protein